MACGSTPAPIIGTRGARCWPSWAPSPRIPSTGASPSAARARRRFPCCSAGAWGVGGGGARRPPRPKRDLYQERAQNGLEPVPGVPEFLHSLERHHVPRAVGTSASRWDAERLLHDLGLLRLFDVVVTGDDVMLGKPDPEVWTQAARRLRVTPGHCVVFEDALVGVQAARAAGMRVIGVTTAHTEGELLAAGADRTIPDFQGLEWSSIAPR